MTLKDVHILNPEICEYAMLHGIGELILWIELMLVIRWPWDIDIILGYQDEPNVTTRDPYGEDEAEESESECYNMRKICLTMTCLNMEGDHKPSDTDSH